jgi:hypothetical protein
LKEYEICKRASAFSIDIYSLKRCTSLALFVLRWKFAKSESKYLTVVYFMIPLFILSMFLPLLVNMQQMDMIAQNQKETLLYPRVIQRHMGLMTPCSDAVYQDYASVQTVLDNIPNAYVADNTAVGSAATITKLKTFLSTTDRTHVAAHGNWDNTPVVVLDSDLKQSVVSQWSNAGTTCKLLFLSACNSMGHSGVQSNSLATAIMGKSGVQQVIGYKDTVDAGGAATFAACFWTYHLWANQAGGGESSDSAFSDAKDDLYQIVADASLQALAAALIIGTIIAIVIGIITLLIPAIPWIASVIAGVLAGIFGFVLFYLFLNSINSAYLNVVKYGTSVDGLTYSSGGGGGGGGGGKGGVLPF